jgi:ABC-type dipeptide/oligopeptide/nickel transport system permease subunit/outer membrane protein assembly factor BamB
MRDPNHQMPSAVHRNLRRTNRPLQIGLVIIGLVVVLALIGPSIAPHDPLEETQIIKVDDEWVTIPFPAFTPGYPLGSDGHGRDLLSRLLWGVRPTLILVVVVAGVRLVLGLAWGVTAGWTTGRAERVLNGVIAAALAVPVLMVALAVIAMVGVDLGLLAFILGLSITGWAEAAQLVRDQTRIVRGEVYTEAARALGETGLQIGIRHVRRQITPMLWMLLAFEMSSTLVVTASLGFLGYYIGGDVWIDIREEAGAAARVAGMPELGQMLAASWVLFQQPWAMFAIGSIIFVTILGFNLIGAGMRLRLNQPPPTRPMPYARTIGRIGQRIEERALLPVTAQDKRVTLRAALIGGIVLVAASGLLLRNAQATPPPLASVTESAVPGGHLWPTERHDSWGTLWAPVRGPSNPTVEWIFEDPAGFAGGPAVSVDGTLYLISKAGTLYALDPTGNKIWLAALPAKGVGAPALNADGDIYAVDEKGLSAFTSKGDLLWRSELRDESIATAGPAIAPDGTIYYTLGGGFVQAVSPEGASLWKTRARELPFNIYSPPFLDPTGEIIFLGAGVVDRGDGSRQALTLPIDVHRYVIGADGRTYLLSENVIQEWWFTPSGMEIVQSATWDYRKFTIGATPSDAGVTPEGIVWFFYASLRDARVVWLDMSSRLHGNARYFIRHGKIIAVDANAVVYVCGASGPNLECVAFARGSEEPIWTIRLERGENVTGGALVPGRLYVATAEGQLYAIGE